jgi:Xaa-Pro aminopeptidase
MSEMGCYIMDYQGRRRALAQRLPANSIAVIPAASVSFRNGDAHARFRQASDFYYLTGFDEPDALLLITSGEQHESILFNRPNDAQQERWDGPRLGQLDAPRFLGVDAAFSYDEIEQRLPEFLLNKQAIYYPMAGSAAHEAMLRAAWREVKAKAGRFQNTPEIFADITSILGELRLIKDDDEIKLMREAVRVSMLAHERVMRACGKAQYEYELEAEFIYALGQEGCRDMAYEPIVAGGARACTLHYIANNQALVPGELVLVDAGAEVGCYAADITRTYPVNGKFSEEQRLIYTLVWRAQQAGMMCVKPGGSWDEVQAAVVEVLTLGLTELGVLQPGNQACDIKTFYMHSAGHWLGLDVHDVGSYQCDGAPRLFEPGMVLTVEPGLYIAADCDEVDARWRGIGVRIEDNVWVTPEGHENLTAALAVSPDALEDLLGG